MSDGDYLPGEPFPAGPIAPEPPGRFSPDMHTRRRRRVRRRPPLLAGVAPGIDPGRVRLVRIYSWSHYAVVESMTPAQARVLADGLRSWASVMEKYP